MNASTIKENLFQKLILKEVFFLLIISLLIHWVIGENYTEMINVLRTANMGWIVTSIALYGLAVYIIYWRWRYLLRLQGIYLPKGTVFLSHMASLCFNTLTPGGILGDFVKLRAVTKPDGSRAPGAVASILIDRILGFYAMLVLVSILIVIKGDFIKQSVFEIRLASLLILLCTAVASIIVLLMFWWKPLIKSSVLNLFLKFIDRRMKRVYLLLLRIGTGLDLYQKHWKACLMLLAASLLSHCILGLSFYVLGVALSLNVDVLLFVFAIQFSAVLALFIPLPGGMGLRDVVGKILLLSAGCLEAEAIACPLLFTGIMIFWAIIGGVCFYFFRRLSSS